jgi:hypothetical protein
MAEKNPLDNRHCTRCNQAKAPADFTALKAGGRDSWCKPCRAAYQRAWRRAHPERARELQRRWDETNRRARELARALGVDVTTPSD